MFDKSLGKTILKVLFIVLIQILILSCLHMDNLAGSSKSIIAPCSFSGSRSSNDSVNSSTGLVNATIHPSSLVAGFNATINVSYVHPSGPIPSLVTAIVDGKYEIDLDKLGNVSSGIDNISTHFGGKIATNLFPSNFSTGNHTITFKYNILGSWKEDNATVLYFQYFDEFLMQPIVLVSGEQAPEDEIPSSKDFSEFRFEILYTNPLGFGPDLDKEGREIMILIIDDDQKDMFMWPEKSNNSAADFSKGVEYSYQPGSKTSLASGEHSISFRVQVNGVEHRFTSDENITINIEKEESIPFYKDKCCYVPMIFITILFVIVLVQNRLLAKKSKGTQKKEPSREDLEVICSKCEKPISSDLEFCPHCGETFEMLESFLCPECSGPVEQGDPFCIHCGLSFEKKNDDVINEKRSSDVIGKDVTLTVVDVRKGKTSGKKGRGKKKAEDEKEDVLVGDDFFCSMCGASVPSSANECPKCGTEFV